MTSLKNLFITCCAISSNCRPPKLRNSTFPLLSNLQPNTEQSVLLCHMALENQSRYPSLSQSPIAWPIASWNEWQILILLEWKWLWTAGIYMKWRCDPRSCNRNQFKQLQILALEKIFRASTGLEPRASAFALQYTTNWAMKTHILWAGQIIELSLTRLPFQTTMITSSFHLCSRSSKSLSCDASFPSRETSWSADFFFLGLKFAIA